MWAPTDSHARSPTVTLHHLLEVSRTKLSQEAEAKQPRLRQLLAHADIYDGLCREHARQALGLDDRPAVAHYSIDPWSRMDEGPKALHVLQPRQDPKPDGHSHSVSCRSRTMDLRFGRPDGDRVICSTVPCNKSFDDRSPDRSFDEDGLEVSVKFVKQYNEYLKWWEQIKQMEESNDRQGFETTFTDCSSTQLDEAIWTEQPAIMSMQQERQIWTNF